MSSDHDRPSTCEDSTIGSIVELLNALTLRFHAQEIINKLLNNCGNQNLQYLLVPSRLEAALLVLNIHTTRPVSPETTPKTEAFDE